MIKLYTSVGRYELKDNGNGMKEPIVTVCAKEMALSYEEMILWTSLMWNIATKEAHPSLGSSFHLALVM